MPLVKGKSREAKAHNYRAEIAAGRPRKQAIAIMLRVAGESRKRKTRRAAKRR